MYLVSEIIAVCQVMLQDLFVFACSYTTEIQNWNLHLSYWFISIATNGCARATLYCSILLVTQMPYSATWPHIFPTGTHMSNIASYQCKISTNILLFIFSPLPNSLHIQLTCNCTMDSLHLCKVPAQELSLWTQNYTKFTTLLSCFENLINFPLYIFAGNTQLVLQWKSCWKNLRWPDISWVKANI